MLPHPTYASMPAHMFSEPDPNNDWNIDPSIRIPNNLPLHTPPTTEPSEWSDSVFLSPMEIHAKGHAYKRMQAATQPSPPSNDIMPSDARPGADFNGPIRCWSDRCNGREFSSIGNYRRHFREQHRVSKKFCCQRCGRPFSRSTARNLHYEKKKCRSVHFDENGVPASLPYASESGERETISPAASPEALSSDESRHASIDSTFSPYGAAVPSQNMTYAEPATQPPYAQPATREQDLALEGSQSVVWDGELQPWGNAMPWNELDLAMEVPSLTEPYDMIRQPALPPWHQSSLVGC